MSNLKKIRIKTFVPFHVFKKSENGMKNKENELLYFFRKNENRMLIKANFRKKVFIFVLICIIVFPLFYYIFSSFGNNKNRNQNEIVDNILNNMVEYEANITVNIISNKNENTYNMDQFYSTSSSKTVINSPENIAGMIIENENNTLKITNTKINMEKIYNDYEYVLNNNLFLSVFVDDYKNNFSEMYEQDDEIILSTKLSNNESTYIKFKELHLNKETGLPKELLMKDNTKKTQISIIYNDIKIK